MENGNLKNGMRYVRINLSETKTEQMNEETFLSY